MMRCPRRAVEVPEELEPRQRGFAALERKGDFRILAQASKVQWYAHVVWDRTHATFDLRRCA